MVVMVVMLAPAMPLPIAKAERQKHPRVMGEMHRADRLKIKRKNLDMVMVMGIGPVV